MNRPWKSSLSSAFAVALLGVALVAQADMMENLQKTTPQERAGFQTAYMQTKLDLPEAEVAKVATVNLEYAQKAEPIIKGSEGSFAKMRQMRALQTEKDAALKSVMSPAHYAAYEAARDDMKEKVEADIERKVKGAN